MANYPVSLPSSTPADHAEVLGEVVAIATELGTDPAGSFSTVKERLNSARGPQQVDTSRYVLLGPEGWSGWGSANFGSNVANSTNKVFCLPYIPRRTLTISEVSVNVFTAADAASGSEIRLAIYENSGGDPSSLLVDCGVASLESTGLKTVTLGSPQQLTVGAIYWVAIFTKVAGATTPLLRAAATGRSPHVGTRQISSNSWDSDDTIWQTYTYPASAPASFPAGAKIYYGGKYLVSGTISAVG